MGRNLFRRIEVAFPVLDTALKAARHRRGAEARISSDNRERLGCCDADGKYVRAKRAGARSLRCAGNSCSTAWPNVRTAG